MIFRQFFDENTWSFSYLIADKERSEAIIIDPVYEMVPQYLLALKELDLKLLFSLDTHVHADHITGSGLLSDHTLCTTVIGQQAKVECVDRKVSEGEQIKVASIKLDVIYTPGHTDDSYSFYMKDRIFTGDTLLIRSTGRTDFQNGSADQQYDSIFNKLLKFPEDTLIYPAHDYKGWTTSTIGEEKKFNPRLKVGSKQEYVDQMNGLKLQNPRFMDVAVPANLKCGRVEKGLIG